MIYFPILMTGNKIKKVYGKQEKAKDRPNSIDGV